MAHTRKDTLTAPPEWWKHLRPYNKRKVAKAERRAVKREVMNIRSEDEEIKFQDSCDKIVEKNSFKFVSTC